MNAKMKTLSFQEELMDVLKFSETDLALNREGRLSIEQMRDLKSRETIRGNALILAGVIAGILWLCWFVVALLRPDTPVHVYMLFIMFIGFSGISVIVGYFQNAELNAEIARGQVESIEGVALVNTESRLQGSIKIDDFPLKINRQALQYVKHLEPHIVYFLPRSKIIVSVEVLGSSTHSAILTV